MKLATVKRIAVTFLINHVYTGTRFFEIKRKMLNSIGHEIGEGTKVVGDILCTGHLVVGRDCWLGRGLTIHGNGDVIIGNCCDIAPDVTFLTGGHEIGDSVRRAGKGEKYTIKVGNGTWIGARTIIGGDTVIGSGCVLAACSCVMKDIDDNVLVGGVPAKLIRKLDT